MHESLAEALEREHQEIDEGIDGFTAASRPDDSEQTALVRAIQALRRHIYLEEEFLFPPLREAGLVAPVAVMLREHGQIWATLDKLQHELDTGADGALARARLLGHQLAVQLQHHNLKEERILYPQADTVLPPEAAASLRAFLDTGELPRGWTCARVTI
jgi:hemerythrin-like domain-containing protein